MPHALDRTEPPGDYFTLVTLRVLDEEPVADELIAWYRKHLYQLVTIRRLEGTADFAFTTEPPTADSLRALIDRLAATEHQTDIAGLEPERAAQLDEPFGADSRIVFQQWKLGEGSWLSSLVGTLNWQTLLDAED